MQLNFVYNNLLYIKVSQMELQTPQAADIT